MPTAPIDHSARDEKYKSTPACVRSPESAPLGDSAGDSADRSGSTLVPCPLAALDRSGSLSARPATSLAPKSSAPTVVICSTQARMALPSGVNGAERFTTGLGLTGASTATRLYAPTVVLSFNPRRRGPYRRGAQLVRRITNDYWPARRLGVGGRSPLLPSRFGRGSTERPPDASIAGVRSRSAREVLHQGGAQSALASIGTHRLLSTDRGKGTSACNRGGSRWRA